MAFDLINAGNTATQLCDPTYGLKNGLAAMDTLYPSSGSFF
jgi:hypothetical protein